MMTMILFFLCMMGCPPKSGSVPQEHSTIKPTDGNQVQNQKRMQTGTFIDGVFRDKSFPLEGAIEDDWELIPQDRFGSRRLLARHKELPVSMEIWHFQDIALQPAQYEFCSWGFLDRGLYGSINARYLTSTCVPHKPSSDYVFAYLHHWGGSTWQFEIHAHPKHAVQGKLLGEDFFKRFLWRGDEDTPILPP